MVSVVLLMLAAAPTSSEVEEHLIPAVPSWSLEARLASPAFLSVAFPLAAGPVGLGGLGLPFTVGLGGAEVAVGRRLGDHLVARLGLASSVSFTVASFVGVALSPGLRWYPRQAFEAFWLGARVPLQMSWLSGQVSGGAASLELEVGCTLALAQWVRVSASAVAGGSAAWSNAGSSSGGFGLRGELAAAVVF